MRVWESILAVAAIVGSTGLTSAAAVHEPEYGIYTSDNGRHFKTLDGKPFFWQADTAWLLFHRLNVTELETYLENRRARGFNMVLVTAVTQLGLSNANRNGDLPLVDEDFTKPNEPYWKEVDDMVELAWEYGIRIAFVPAWGYHVHLDTNVAGGINESNAHAFGTWFGQRYPYTPKLLVGDTNPYWTNKTAVKLNYAAGGVPPKYEFTDYAPVYEAMARGLYEAQPASQITIHCTNQWFAGTPVALASANFGDSEWLSFDTSQSGHADYPPNPPIEWWNARRGYETIQLMYNNVYSDKVRPVLDNEPHYENRYNNGKKDRPYWNASDVRIGSYQSVFSGAAGLTYGSENIMQIYIPDLFDSAGSGPAVSWDTELALPGGAQMQFIKKVLQDRKAYPGLVPDGAKLIVGDAGRNDSHVAALRDTEGTRCILVYTPTGEAFTLSLEQFYGGQAAGGVVASWYDPLKGTYEEFELQGGEAAKQVTFEPPMGEGHDDWVLVLEREDP